MKLFDPRAALAEIEKQAPTPATSATSATSATIATLTPKSTPSVAIVADVAASRPQIEKTTPADRNAANPDTRHGFAINGHPKTWTGKIVSLDAWRQLSAWEKHGPDGRHWNGQSKSWETPT